MCHPSSRVPGGRPLRRPGGAGRIRGLTLLELVCVLLGLALLAFVLVPRLSALGHVDVNQQAEQFRRDVVRVQLLAIGQSQRLRLSVTPGGYSVLRCSAPASCNGPAVREPQTGADFSVLLKPGAAFASAATLDFDTLGRPSQAAGLLPGVTSFTLAGGGQTARIEVLPLTGYARVVP